MQTPNTDSLPKPRVVIPRVFIAGEPIPQGSMKATAHKKTGRIVTFHSNSEKLKPWRDTLQKEALLHADRSLCRLSSGGYVVAMTFVLPRPQYHYGKDKTIKEQFVYQHHRAKPDLDKLVRAVLDALSHSVWEDDAHVIGFTELMKTYGEVPGLFLTIGHIDLSKEKVTDAGILL